jgi:Ni2+-binding GTPase involved in maturation of urease and hydrogenase
MDANATPRPVLIPLGGFLGAGKTTLIIAASRLLQSQGLKPAAILNDQGAELVDTRHVQQNGIEAGQVSGGCFCCRFSDLIESAETLRAYSPDVIFAEAVGSCTDISATTLQPLKLYYSHEFRLAPYSVLIDPAQAEALRAPDADPDLAFLFQKQIEEADLVCFTKADLYSTFPDVSAPAVRYLSPLTGEGVAAWLDEILTGEMDAGTKLLEIDYERYARAEARLAWLNCRAAITLQEPLSPAMVLGPLVDDLDAALTAAGLRIAHLKATIDSPAGYVKASLVRNGEEPFVEGMLDASPEIKHELLLNIRAAGNPATLHHAVESQIAKMRGSLDFKLLQCFSPAAPEPQYRFQCVIAGDR